MCCLYVFIYLNVFTIGLDDGCQCIMMQRFYFVLVILVVFCYYSHEIHSAASCAESQNSVTSCVMLVESAANTVMLLLL